ncbi:hypothetical protein [Corynebacterium frankenforstense]
MTSPETTAAETAAPAEHPVIAVVDAGQARTVVWHVQTNPDFSSPAAILSGAWVLSEESGDVDPDRLDDLLTGTVVARTEAAVERGLSFPTAAGVLPGSGAGTLAAMAEPIRAAATEISAAVAAAKEKNPQVKGLLLPKVEVPDPGHLADAYHGGSGAKTCWALARAVADVVDGWHAVENKRRSRAFLKDEFGRSVRPIPLPELE